MTRFRVFADYNVRERMNLVPLLQALKVRLPWLPRGWRCGVVWCGSVVAAVVVLVLLVFI